MPQVNMPVHPARQQGLGAPQEQGNQNPYYRPSTALDGYNASLQQAQAMQAQAQAEKAAAETAILRGGLGSPAQMAPQEAPEVSPQQVQAEQIADGIIKGQVSQGDIQGLIHAGQIDPAVADAAVGMAHQFLQADQARLQQSQGLGGL